MRKSKVVEPVPQEEMFVLSNAETKAAILKARLDLIVDMCDPDADCNVDLSQKAVLERIRGRYAI